MKTSRMLCVGLALTVALGTTVPMNGMKKTIALLVGGATVTALPFIYRYVTTPESNYIWMVRKGHRSAQEGLRFALLSSTCTAAEITWLVQKGADLNQPLPSPYGDGELPLEYTTTHFGPENIDYAFWLVQKGATVSDKNMNDLLPLAARSGHSNLIKLLFDKCTSGRDHSDNNTFHTLLAKAANGNHIQCLEVLFNQSISDRNNTALIDVIVAGTANRSCFNKLMQHAHDNGDSLDTGNPLAEAARRGNRLYGSLLIEYGANPLATTPDPNNLAQQQTIAQICPQGDKGDFFRTAHEYATAIATNALPGYLDQLETQSLNKKYDVFVLACTYAVGAQRTGDNLSANQKTLEFFGKLPGTQKRNLLKRALTLGEPVTMLTKVLGLTNLGINDCRYILGLTQTGRGWFNWRGLAKTPTAYEPDSLVAEIKKMRDEAVQTNSEAGKKLRTAISKHLELQRIGNKVSQDVLGLINQF